MTIVIAGVDEAGRGPLAGPLVAAAAIIPATCANADWVLAIDDSKKLSAKKRDFLFTQITAHCPHAIATASVVEIDTLNILQATLLAMRRAVLALDPAPDHVLVDGNQPIRDLPMPCVPVIGGDGLHRVIGAASILAKVTRDRMLQELDGLYPQYGFAQHAGYGTAQHLAALRAHGPCPEHRRSFAPVRSAGVKAG